MDKQGNIINVMNAEHVALLAYMQRYVQSITKEGKRPGEVIQASHSSLNDSLKKNA